MHTLAAFCELNRDFVNTSNVPFLNPIDPPPVEFRVIHFILDHRVGGPHVYVQTLSAALGTVVSSTLVTAGSGPVTEVALLNLRRWFRPLYSFEVLFNAFFIMIRFGVFRRPSLFHVHGVVNIAPLLAAFFCRVPVVWHFHETVNSQRYLALLGGLLIRNTRHHVVTAAKSARETFSQPSAIWAPAAVNVKFWDLSKADNNGCDQKLKNHKVLHFLTIANLNPLKGIDVLIDALPLTHQPIELNIIGAELDTQEKYIKLLKKKASEISDQRPDIVIRFLGEQSSESIRTYLSKCDVFIVSSRSEAGPIVLLEAMAMARPVITTDVGSVRDFLPISQNAFICSPDDSFALASSIKEIYKLSSAEREMLGQENRSAIELKFTPERLADNLLRCYRSL